MTDGSMLHPAEQNISRKVDIPEALDVLIASISYQSSERFAPG